MFHLWWWRLIAFLACSEGASCLASWAMLLWIMAVVPTQCAAMCDHASVLTQIMHICMQLSTCFDSETSKASILLFTCAIAPSPLPQPHSWKAKATQSDLHHPQWSGGDSIAIWARVSKGRGQSPHYQFAPEVTEMWPPPSYACSHWLLSLATSEALLCLPLYPWLVLTPVLSNCMWEPLM